MRRKSRGKGGGQRGGGKEDETSLGVIRRKGEWAAQVSLARLMAVGVAHVQRQSNFHPHSRAIPVPVVLSFCAATAGTGRVHFRQNPCMLPVESIYGSNNRELLENESISKHLRQCAVCRLGVNSVPVDTMPPNTHRQCWAAWTLAVPVMMGAHCCKLK